MDGLHDVIWWCKALYHFENTNTRQWMWWKYPWTERRLSNNSIVDVYLFQKLDNLLLDRSCWNVSSENFNYSKRMKKLPSRVKGSDILKNIESRSVIQCDIPKRLDYIAKHTINKLHTESKNRKRGVLVWRDKILLTKKGQHV